MLILDEQFVGHNLEQQLEQWYRGPVRLITALHPGTLIKDDAVPLLLRQHNGVTFVTINESDFWREIAIDKRFCVICFAVSQAHISQIPALLRAVFTLALFRTKAARMGKVLRATQRTVSYYAYDNREVQSERL